MTTDTAAHATSARVRDEFSLAGMFDLPTPERERHQALTNALLRHFDRHVATETEPARCCDRLAVREQNAWADVQRAEGWS